MAISSHAPSCSLVSVASAAAHALPGLSPHTASKLRTAPPASKRHSTRAGRTHPSRAWWPAPRHSVAAQSAG
eukprot:7035606-Alexandrium_andersonii.AAC.1